jgi:hypothetical protein
VLTPALSPEPSAVPALPGRFVPSIEALRGLDTA